MATKLGNVGASSLLKSAQSAAATAQTYQDNLAGFTFAESAKTDSDWATYEKYLQGRITQTQTEGNGQGNPAKSLALTRTLDDAQKSYFSSTIQRQNIAINYGNSSLEDKQGQLLGLYKQAISFGDLSDAQSLEYQYTNVNKQIQDAATAAAKAASTYKGGYDTAAGSSYNEALTNIDTLQKKADLAFQSGKLSSQAYATITSQLNGEGTSTTPGKQSIFQHMQDNFKSLSQDDYSKLVGQADTFLKSDNYKTYNPQTLQNIQNGQIRFGYSETPVGGGKFVRTAVNLPQSGIDPKTGMPSYQTQGVKGNNFFSVVKSANGAKDIQVNTLQNDSSGSGVKVYQDATGVHYVSKDGLMTANTPDYIKKYDSGALGAPINKPGTPGYKPGQPQVATPNNDTNLNIAKELLNPAGAESVIGKAAKTMTDLTKAAIKNPVIDKGFGELARTASPLLGEAQDLISRVTGNGNAQKNAQAKANQSFLQQGESLVGKLIPSLAPKSNPIVAPPKPSMATQQVALPSLASVRDTSANSTIPNFQKVMNTPGTTAPQAVQALLGFK
jgi:hypothetical protein